MTADCCRQTPDYVTLRYVTLSCRVQSPGGLVARRSSGASAVISSSLAGNITPTVSLYLTASTAVLAFPSRLAARRRRHLALA